MKNPITLKMFCVVFACCLLAPIASAQVIISEIMYNPDSNEGGFGDNAQPNQTEWLEIYNTGDEAVSIAGWILKDEDGQTAALPDGATIAPGEAIVLIPGVQTIEDFRAAWETEEAQGFQVFALNNWATGDNALRNLANGPSDTNEILTLRDGQGNIIDEVNYDDEGDWPRDSPDGSSIILKSDQLDAVANDQGSAWPRAADGELGAHGNTQTDDYDGQDMGSPGVVVTE